jgi:HEAT repeat protein
VQRLGNQALRRVSQRFPALAELLERGSIGIRAWAAPQTSASAAGTTYPWRAPEPAAPDISETAPRAHLSSPHWEQRLKAVQNLGEEPHSLHVPALLAALRDESAEVASAAALALGARGGEEASAALREVLANRQGFFSPVTRAAAVQALGRCLPAAELDPVRAALCDVDAEVSLAAIATLAQAAPKDAVRDLLPILQDVTGYFLPLVRLAAANALLQTTSLGEDEITAILSRERDPAIQRLFGAARAATTADS